MTYWLGLFIVVFVWHSMWELFTYHQLLYNEIIRKSHWSSVHFGGEYFYQMKYIALRLTSVTMFYIKARLFDQSGFKERKKIKAYARTVAGKSRQLSRMLRLSQREDDDSKKNPNGEV